MSDSAVSVSPQEFGRAKRVLSEPRRLAAGDAIEFSIEVAGKLEIPKQRCELSGDNGVVTIPLVGDVELGGLLPREVKDVLLAAYSRYYVNTPMLMLKISGESSDGEWGYVRILGQVSRPGRVPLDSPDGMHLSDVIQEAGGFAASAKKDGIRVSRQDSNGRQVQCVVDLNSLGDAGSMDVDLELGSGDVVYVPERIF